jgi:hypothetical protein
MKNTKHSLRTVTRRFMPSGRATIAAFITLAAAASLPGQQLGTVEMNRADPRVGLRGGWNNAQEAIRGLQLVAHRPRPERFFNPSDAGDFSVINSDMAFDGTNLFVGSYTGFQIWDIATPANPTLRTAFFCPGGQGDVSVHKNLLFMSVEETRGRVDCGDTGVSGASSPERFRGVRIFDISNITSPRQVGAVQTCRGSHTHTLVPDPKDPSSIYVYVSGTGDVRPGSELRGCTQGEGPKDSTSAFFRIEVIKVPLAAPQDARTVNRPRVFADRTTDANNGLWKGGNHGAGTQETSVSDNCHDVTVYPEIGLAAGACSGNGILLDISDPANPARIDQVIDKNFAYWHAATFNNTGDKLIFTDEWGGGVGAKCRSTDKMEWGANAIFSLSERKLTARSHYKIPAPQSENENCVAHNGSLIPVPGRDIMVQAWYQGGMSVFDFTNASQPKEIAYFDRGPITPGRLTLAGFWSAYWYNGHIYGSEIGRGIDILSLTPSADLTQNEIDAAMTYTVPAFNPQLQTRMTWPASFVLARAYNDQLIRGRGVTGSQSNRIRMGLARAESLGAAERRGVLTVLGTQIDRMAVGSRDAAKVRLLSATVKELATK